MYRSTVWPHQVLLYLCVAVHYCGPPLHHQNGKRPGSQKRLLPTFSWAANRTSHLVFHLSPQPAILITMHFPTSGVVSELYLSATRFLGSPDTPYFPHVVFHLSPQPAILVTTSPLPVLCLSYICLCPPFLGSPDTPYFPHVVFHLSPLPLFPHHNLASEQCQHPMSSGPRPNTATFWCECKVSELYLSARY